MTSLRVADSDLAFRRDFEEGRVTPAEFNHRAHVRLAYAYLADSAAEGADMESAITRVREGILAFLARHQIDPSKYHETMTRAWVMAVRHFMERTAEAESADAFIELNPELLDSGIMMTHYSAGLLFSDEARARWVEPDLDRIPRYGS
jgi:hypothetical protein